MVFGYGDKNNFSPGDVEKVKFRAHTQMQDDIGNNGSAFITWGNVKRSDSEYTLDANGYDIICNFTGEIEITATCNIGGATNRVELAGYLYVNGVRENDSYKSNYAARDSNQNEGGITIVSYNIEVNQGDYISFFCETDTDGGSSANILPKGTRIKIKRIA